jgi:hypothetical protein
MQYKIANSIDVSMLLTLNNNSDKNDALNNNNSNKNESGDASSTIYPSSTTTTSFNNVSSITNRITNTESTTTVTTATITSAEIMKNIKISNKIIDSFLLDGFGLKKIVSTTPIALASENTYFKKNNGVLSAILNMITASGGEDDGVEMMRKIEKIYSPETVTVTSSTKTTTTTTTTVASTVTVPTSTRVEEMTSSSDATTIATFAAFKTTKYATVVNMSANAQLKKNDQYEMPLTIRFAPSYKRGKIVNRIK